MVKQEEISNKGYVLHFSLYFLSLSDANNSLKINGIFHSLTMVRKTIFVDIYSELIPYNSKCSKKSLNESSPEVMQKKYIGRLQNKY